MYQEFKGNKAIKTELSRFIFKQFSQWIYKRNLDMKNGTQILLKNRAYNKKTMHFIFPANIEGPWIYNSQDDSSFAKGINLSILINNDKIFVDIYLDHDTVYNYSNPIAEIDFNYMQALKDEKIVTKEKSQPVVSNKQAMNECIKKNMVDFLIDMFDYFVIDKKMPKGFEKYNEETLFGCDEFISDYIKLKNIEGNKYSDCDYCTFDNDWNSELI